MTATTYAFGAATRTDPTGAYAVTLDASGRETGLTDPFSHPSGDPYSWTYGATGALVASADPTGNATSLAYDPAGRLATKTTRDRSGTSVRASDAYTYNRASNALADTATIAGDAASGTTSYAYDPLSRLTGYAPPTGDPGRYTWATTPDRTSLTSGTGTPLTTSFDAASRPVSDSAGGTYRADAEGRLTALPGMTLTYDALGRLRSVGTGGSTTSYTYDALDRLATLAHGGTTTRFGYVGLTSVLAVELDDATGAVLVQHVTDWAGQSLLDVGPGGVSHRAYLGTNGHGDLTWTADESGAVTGSLHYDPFGGLTGSSGAELPDRRWQGSFLDASTGLYWVLARWYAPALGTFLSPDPAPGAESEPQSRDLYAYGAGDPVDRVDPDGTRWHKVRSGESLSSISRKYFGGQSSLWPMIFNANRDTIANPNLIFANQCIYVPGLWYTGYASDRAGNGLCSRGTTPPAPYRSAEKVKLDRNTRAAILFGGDIDEILYQEGRGGYWGAWFNLTRSDLYNDTWSRIGDRTPYLLNSWWERYWRENATAGDDVAWLLFRISGGSGTGTILTAPYGGPYHYVYGNATLPRVLGAGTYAVTLGRTVYWKSGSGGWSRYSPPPKYIQAHEYIHVLEWEGRGSDMYADFLRNLALQGTPYLPYERPAYLWSAWIYAYGPVDPVTGETRNWKSTEPYPWTLFKPDPI